MLDGRFDHYYNIIELQLINCLQHYTSASILLPSNVSGRLDVRFRAGTHEEKDFCAARLRGVQSFRILQVQASHETNVRRLQRQHFWNTKLG